MGKYLKRKDPRSAAHVAVMEGSLGVRSQQNRKRKSNSCDGSSEAAPDTKEQIHEDQGNLNEASGSSCVQEDELGDVEENSSPILRESHSESCLGNKSRTRRRILRSNSATFSGKQRNSISPQEQTLQLEEAQHQDQAQASCGDNVPAKERVCESNKFTTLVPVINPCSVSASTSTSVPAAGTSAPAGSSSSTLVRDCGPAWRHRVPNVPSADEIENFFARVEEDDDKSTRMFSERPWYKYWYAAVPFSDGILPLPSDESWIQRLQKHARTRREDFRFAERPPSCTETATGCQPT